MTSGFPVEKYGLLRLFEIDAIILENCALLLRKVADASVLDPAPGSTRWKDMGKRRARTLGTGPL